jgi:hypothetical protein
MTRLISIAAAAVLLTATAAGAQTLGLENLPDDTRATTKKELARRSADKRQAPNKSDTATADSTAEGGKAAAATAWHMPRGKQDCSMSIAAAEPQDANKRKLVVVITKPVIQVCK